MEHGKAQNGYIDRHSHYKANNGIYKKVTRIREEKVVHLTKGICIRKRVGLLHGLIGLVK